MCYVDTTVVLVEVTLVLVLRLAEWGVAGVELAIADRVEVHAHDVFYYVNPGNLSDARGPHAG